MNLKLIKMICSFLLVSFIGYMAPVAFADEVSAQAKTEQTNATTDAAPSTTAEADKAEPAKNPYGMEALWSQGDFVARGTLIILAIMSLGTWYIGILKYFEQSKLFKQAKEATEKFWAGNSIPAGIENLDEESAYRYIADTANKAANKHDDNLLNHIDLSNWVDMSIQRAVNLVSNRLQGGLSFLATVGSTGPFVGLFGTVWGIYHALTAIGMSGQASIDKVAGPVGEALIMTAMGLAVAVPAVLGYNWLVRRNKVVMEQVRHFSAELHMVLLATKKPVE